MRIFSRCALPGAIALTLAAFAPLHAQTPQQAPIVREIAIEFVGPEAITRDRVLANLATKVGQPYSQFDIEQDIRALYATGVVSNVRMFGEPAPDGVKVTVLLQGKPSIQEILIEGTGQIAMNRVRKEIGSKVGDPVSEERLEDDRQKILKLYEDRNYTDVDVQYVVKDVPNTGLVSVIYSINEGPKMVVKRISFAGNDSILPRDLAKAMKTKKQDWLTIFNKSGRLLPANEEEDKAAVRSLYQNRGFADAQVLGYDVQPLKGTGVELVISVQEGIQYHVNSVAFEGVAVASPEELKSRLAMVDGSLYTPSGMTKDLKGLRDYYGVRGYVDMMALPEVLPAGPGAVDITYRVDEGVQSYVNLVNIQGNTRTRDHVIRRELAIKPGEIFDTTRVDLSKERLNNLNYFSKVDAIPADTLVPGRKDLNIIVEEKRTGSFNFGAGFSSID
ncbi:MAG TPA: outer membrane protein assembly factor BamA, partial [Chthoniobacterales bacterium]